MPEVTMWKVSIFGVFLVLIQSECGKIRTRKTPNMDPFHAVSSYLQVIYKLNFWWNPQNIIHDEFLFLVKLYQCCKFLGTITFQNSYE